jgi:hypothetical protein
MPSVASSQDAVQGPVLQTYCTYIDNAGYEEEVVVSSDACDVPWDLVIPGTIKGCQPCLVVAMFADTARISFQKPFAL